MLTALLVEFIARRQSKTAPFSRATLNFHRFSATANGAEIGTHRASGNSRVPRAEFASLGQVLADPESASERLALLTRVECETGPHLIVTTRASLSQAAPRRGALQSAIVQLQRGANEKMERVLEELAGAGYER